MIVERKSSALDVIGMKSKANSIVLLSLILAFALSMAGCETTLCVSGDFTVQEPGAKARIKVKAPVTVKKGHQWCRYGLVVRGKPKVVRTIWRKKGGNGKWTPADPKNEYITDNIGQVLEYMIDVNALEAAVTERYGKDAEPYEVRIPPRYSFLTGLRLGRKHCIGQIKTYRLLIMLIKEYPRSSETCDLDRREFLRGMTKAYADANHAPSEAQSVENLLKKALLIAETFDDAFRQGVRYIEGKATNDEIANTIRRYLRPPERELAYKAGYIEGYVQTHARTEKEGLYKDAEWMYLSLRLPDRP